MTPISGFIVPGRGNTDKRCWEIDADYFLPHGGDEVDYFPHTL